MQGFFIPYSVNTGEYNMDMDEKILSYAIKNNLSSPVLRFYGWKPSCVSLGRNQSDEHLNKQFCMDNNIDIVRRLTGGRALLHDNELTYSFVCPTSFLKHGDTVIESYKEISSALAFGFKSLGLDVDFPEEMKAKTKFEYCMSLSTGADLSYKGRKIVGSAQFRSQGYILQHGSIMFDYNESTIENIFGEKPRNEKICLLKDDLSDVDYVQLCCALKTGFQQYFNIEFIDFSVAL